jgi:hypothetical protein
LGVDACARNCTHRSAAKFLVGRQIRRRVFRARRSVNPIQTRLQAFERRGRHVFNAWLGIDTLVHVPLLRQGVTAVRARREMRVQALPLILTDAAIDIPWNEHSEFFVFARGGDSTVCHSILPVDPDEAPLNDGRYWRNFSRA